MGDENGGVGGGKPDLAGKSRISTFWCPSQPDVTLGAAKNGYATSNYNGNMGTLIGSSGDDCYSGGIDTAAEMAATGGCMGADGIFFISSKVNFRDVTDGLSNTIFVSEVVDSGGDSGNLGGTGSDRKHCFSGGADSNPPTEMTEYLIAAESNDPINSWGEEAAGSYHKGGAQFVFGDGSVKFLSENMSMTIYQAISTRAGGEVTGEY